MAAIFENLVNAKKTSKEDTRKQNIMAVSAISNIVKTSLGPNGLDKMLVDDIGDVTVTNDGATILKMLEVEHPAAKILCELADLQDKEVGDGTTSVVILAAELLKNSQDLSKWKVHPTVIISGYRLACKEACKYIQEHLSIDTEELNRENLTKNIDFFSKMVVDAALSVSTSPTDVGLTANVSAKEKKTQSGTKCLIKNVKVLKSHGGCMTDSVFLNGFALNCNIASQAMPTYIKEAKIACIDFSLNKAKMSLGCQIVVNDPSALTSIREREVMIVKERIAKIITAGANVVLTTGGIDDLCLKPFVEANVMAVRRCTKADLIKISKITGAVLISSLGNLDGGESFESSFLGNAQEVKVEKTGDAEWISVCTGENCMAASIILRGPNDVLLDEAERSLHDALCVVKRVIESRKVVPGGGAVETALNIHLENFATSIASREQLAVAAFAKTILVIPKILAENAALDSMELVSKLRSLHNQSQTSSQHESYKWFGLNLKEATLVDNKENGVLEPMMSKIKCLKFATEVAITILRIDDMIALNPEKPDNHYN